MTEPAAGKFDTVDIGPLARDLRYKLIMGCIVPRPIAFVSSLNPDGSVNAAPFSAFSSLSAQDGIIGFSVNRKDGADDAEEKDTLRNIRRNGEYVINTVPDTLAHQVQACGIDLPPGVSEVDAAGLTLVPSTTIATPRIAETRVQFECKLHSIHQFGTGSLIAGVIQCIHLAEGLLFDHKVRLDRYAPLGRLAGRNYCHIGEIVSA